MIKPQQLDFPSLAFPSDRTVLTVGEVATRWNVSDWHIINLIEEGKLPAFNISGRYEYQRIPASAIPALAAAFKTTPEQIIGIIRAATPQQGGSRSHYRIPVESYQTFIRENNSLNLDPKLNPFHQSQNQ
jgi:excisionase family DNA binding protein